MHWRPDADGYVGDMIPFYHGGMYHVFYLERRGRRPYPWRHIASRDLASWEEWPDALLPGPAGAPDAGGCWTGSVVERGGRFYCFYTGYNPERRHPQVICVATSRDLAEWEKADGVVLEPREPWYEERDFRDPFVFYNEEAGEWWMLICARDARVPGPRNGCVALATSADLEEWELHEPLWSPWICYAPECPDVFQAGGRWYLMYSHGQTRYRWAEASEGPFLGAVADSLDTEQLRAAKRVYDGRRHVLFGWIGTRQGNRDDGAVQWGGHMGLPRALRAGEGGRLLVEPAIEPAQFADGRAAALGELEAEPLAGAWQVGEDWAFAERRDGVAVLKLQAPADWVLEFAAEPEGEAVEFGVLVRMAPDGSAGRKLAVAPAAGAVRLHSWSSWADGEPIYVRPAELARQPVKVCVVMHGSILEAFVGREVSLASRLYSPAAGWIGLYVANGACRFGEVKLYPLPPLR